MTSITTTIVERVARKKGTTPDSLPTLYDTVDPDALELLFEEDSQFDGRLSFEYADMTVTVDGDRNVTVSESLRAV